MHGKLTVDELNVIIRVKTQDLQRGLSGVQSQLRTVENQVSASSSKISGSMKKIGAAMIAAFSIRAIVNFGKQAVSLASDLQEVENVVNTSFGSMTNQVNVWASTTVKKFGMSELSAKRTASTYMAMSKGMGMAGQQAARMAMEVAGRTADIASFYNMSQQEADTMLKSIWTGETESLKRIGVVMTQANLDAYALANGFGKTTDAMTQSEQVMLRYQFVMDQTRLAAGDFLKTSGSWANQTRLLSEQFKQLMTILGSGLIQVLTPVLQVLNEILSRLIDMAKVASQFLSSLFGIEGKQDSLGQAGEWAQDTANGLQGATEQAKKLKGALAGIDELNVLGRGTNNSAISPLPFPSSGIPQAVGPSEFPDMDTTKIEAAAKRVRDAFSGIMNHPITLWLKGKFVDAWNFSLDRVRSWFSFFTGQRKTFENILSNVKELTDKLWKLTEPIADSVWVTLKTTLSELDKVMQSLAGAALYLWEKITELYNVVLDFLESIGWLQYEQNKILNFINFIRNNVQSLSTYLSERIEAFKKIFGGVITFLTGVFQLDFEKSLDGLKQTFSGFVDSLKEKTNYAKSVFGNIKTFAVETFDNIWTHIQEFGKKLWDGLNSMPRKIGEGLGKATAKVTQWGSDLSNWAKTKPKEIVDKTVSFFSTLPERLKIILNQVIDFFNKLPEKFAGFGKNLISGIWNGICSMGNWIKEKISDFFGGFADGFLGGLGKGKEEKVTPIPKLAVGGLAYGPTLAMIGEGRDREAVLPLNQSVYSELAQGIQAAGGQSNRETVTLLERILQAVTQIDPTLVMDGTTLARSSNSYFEAEQRRRGPSLVKVV